jgi:hypothetical protein
MSDISIHGTFPAPRITFIFAPMVRPVKFVVRVGEGFGHAAGLAYAEPFDSRDALEPVVLEGSEAGRDPSW